MDICKGPGGLAAFLKVCTEYVKGAYACGRYHGSASHRSGCGTYFQVGGREHGCAYTRYPGTQRGYALGSYRETYVCGGGRGQLHAGRVHESALRGGYDSAAVRTCQYRCGQHLRFRGSSGIRRTQCDDGGRTGGTAYSASVRCEYDGISLCNAVGMYLGS